MVTFDWPIDCPTPHSVRLEHDYWSGRAAIWIDGKEVYRRGFTLVDFGLTYRLQLDGAEVTVKVLSRWGGYYRYELWVNDKCVAATAPFIETKWQFSFRTLLVLMTLVALVLGVIAALN